MTIRYCWLVILGLMLAGAGGAWAVAEPPVEKVPEVASSLLLLGAGLLGVALVARKK